MAGPASSATRSSHAAVDPRRPPAARRSATARARRAPRGAPSSSSSASAASSASSAVARRHRAPPAVQRDELLGVLALHPGLDEAAIAELDHSERLRQLRGGTLRGGGGVVQLVREPGGHRAERGEPLAVLLDRGHAAHHRARPAASRAGVRRLGAAPGAGSPRAGSAPRRQSRLGLHPDAERRPGEHGDRTHPGRRVLATDRLDPSRSTISDLRLCPRAAASARAAPRPARRSARPARRRTAGRPRPTRASSLVVEVVEQVDGCAASARVNAALGHASTRYSWISDTAIEPSPTALATRLIERARTSPATNTPGTRRLEHVGLALQRPAVLLRVAARRG